MAGLAPHRLPPGHTLAALQPVTWDASNSGANSRPRWLACVLHPVSGVSHAACLDRATSAAYVGYEVSSFDISGGNIRAGPSVG